MVHGPLCASASRPSHQRYGLFFDGRCQCSTVVCGARVRVSRSAGAFLPMADPAPIVPAVVESDGRHTRAINIKRRGTAPLADLVRVHALAIGAQSINSFERLKDIIDAAILPLGRGQDLYDALEFISRVRARHQAEDLAAGVDPDNSIDPEKLSEFERKSLRDAFLILGNAQKFLKYRYQPGRAN